MIDEHDQDVILRCRKLGHEVAFGYCRRENFGKPCRLILDCWWERFDVRGFLQAHLALEAMEQVERASAASLPQKVLNLLDLVQQAKGQPGGSAPPGKLQSRERNPGTSE
jgi:hypothetical protein